MLVMEILFFLSISAEFGIQPVAHYRAFRLNIFVILNVNLLFEASFASLKRNKIKVALLFH